MVKHLANGEGRRFELRLPLFRVCCIKAIESPTPPALDGLTVNEAMGSHRPPLGTAGNPERPLGPVRPRSGNPRVRCSRVLAFRRSSALDTSVWSVIVTPSTEPDPDARYWASKVWTSELERHSNASSRPGGDVGSALDGVIPPNGPLTLKVSGCHWMPSPSQSSPARRWLAFAGGFWVSTPPAYRSSSRRAMKPARSISGSELLATGRLPLASSTHRLAETGPRPTTCLPGVRDTPEPTDIGTSAAKVHTGKSAGALPRRIGLAPLEHPVIQPNTDRRIIDDANEQGVHLS